MSDVAHQHEAWQIRVSDSGGKYCAACGAKVDEREERYSVVVLVMNGQHYEHLKERLPSVARVSLKLGNPGHELHIESNYDTWEVRCQQQGCNYRETDDPEWSALPWDAPFTAALFARMQANHTSNMMHDERKRMMEEMESKLLTQAQVPEVLMGTWEEQPQRFSDTEQGQAIEQAKQTGHWVPPQANSFLDEFGSKPERSMWEGYAGE